MTDDTNDDNDQYNEYNDSNNDANHRRITIIFLNSFSLSRFFLGLIKLIKSYFFQGYLAGDIVPDNTYTTDVSIARIAIDANQWELLRELELYCLRSCCFVCVAEGAKTCAWLDLYTSYATILDKGLKPHDRLLSRVVQLQSLAACDTGTKWRHFNEVRSAELVSVFNPEARKGSLGLV